MMHEVRSIPAAPRRVRLGAILAHRWPMGLLGASMVGIGGLLSWMLFLAAGAKPSDQHRLDAGPNDRVEGTVDGVDDTRIRGPGGLRWQWIDYHFTYGDRQITGKAMAPFGTITTGMAAEVEVAPEAPHINRIIGSTLHFDRAWLAPESWFVAVVIPGALLLLGWLASAFRIRHVLVHGDVSSGRVLSVEPVRWSLPEMVRVRFEFRDHRAVMRRGSHWVRTHSVLGAKVVRQVHTGWFEPLPVLHDRHFPQWNRMLLAMDFLRTPFADELEIAG